ncbi:vitamin B12 dependent-methionine synthase activation domain-containing protein [Chloroflexota bacterium]
MEVLDNIPVRLDKDRVIKRLRLGQRGVQVEGMLKELVDVTVNVARPKALYTVSYVNNKNGASLEIDSIKFTSRVLRVNLDKVGRVFPYVATCGKELGDVTTPSGDMLRTFCLDTIKGIVLEMAVGYLSAHIEQKYALKKISHMNPGSLEDWPLTQQKELFSLFGDVETLIGVRLTDSYAMQPLKSVSGIYFPTKITFESCQLCSRRKCVGRRAPYDPALVRKYGLS